MVALNRAKVVPLFMATSGINKLVVFGTFLPDVGVVSGWPKISPYEYFI